MNSISSYMCSFLCCRSMTPSKVSQDTDLKAHLRFKPGLNIRQTVALSIERNNASKPSSGKKGVAGLSGDLFMKGYSKKNVTQAEYRGFQQMRALNSNTPECKLYAQARFQLGEELLEEVIVTPKVLGRNLSEVDLREYSEAQKTALIHDLGLIFVQDIAVGITDRLVGLRDPTGITFLNCPAFILLRQGQALRKTPSLF